MLFFDYTFAIVIYMQDMFTISVNHVSLIIMVADGGHRTSPSPFAFALRLRASPSRFVSRNWHFQRPSHGAFVDCLRISPSRFAFVFRLRTSPSCFAFALRLRVSPSLLVSENICHNTCRIIVGFHGYSVTISVFATQVKYVLQINHSKYVFVTATGRSLWTKSYTFWPAKVYFCVYVDALHYYVLLLNNYRHPGLKHVKYLL